MTFSIVFRRAARIEFEKAAVWYDEQCTATWRRVHRRDRTSHRERGGRTSAVSTHFRGYTSRRCAALSVFGVLSSPFKQIGCPRSISRSSGSDDLAATGITPGGTDGQKRPAVHHDVGPHLCQPLRHPSTVCSTSSDVVPAHGSSSAFKLWSENPYAPLRGFQYWLLQ